MATLPYALVGKRRQGETGSVVLAEFSFDSNGPFAQWGRDILDREEGQPAGKGVDGHTMLLLEREGLVFFVAAKKGADRAGREALQLIASSFAARIGMARARGATRRYAFNAEFSAPMQRHLEKFSKQGELDEDLAELQSDLESVKGKAQGTIAKMVERGNALHSLSNASSSLASGSSAFQSAATKLRRMEMWQSMKGKLTVLLVVVIVILFIWLLVKS